MIKRRNKISLLSRGGLLCLILMTVAMPGCKKKEPPPPPPKATPLPQKAAQGAPAPAAQPAKPVQAALSSSKKTPAAATVQSQVSSSKRITAPNGVTLDFTSRRDPFKPYAQMPLQQQAAAGNNSKVKVKDPLPIQRYETEKFRISGIVTGLKENTALIMDPTNKGYVVKKGMLIGSSEGVIKTITSNTVEVEESFRDDKGRIKKRVVKLTLLRKK